VETLPARARERLGVELRVAADLLREQPGELFAGRARDELVGLHERVDRGELSFLTRDGESLRDSLEDDGACPTVIGHEAAIIAEFLRGSKTW